MTAQNRNSKVILFLIRVCNKFFRKFILNAVGENSLSEIGKFERDGWYEVIFKNLKLDIESRILIVGGYKGNSTYEYRKRYGCNVVALEPVKSYFDFFEKRFAGDSKVSIKNLALADESGQLEITVNADSTGFYEKSNGALFETITCVGVRDFFTPPFERFDLIEMNIEGAEYQVLNSILKLNLQSNINTFLIQFHRNVPDFEREREKIRNVLEKSHNPVFCYDYVWERWDLKTSN
jgi:FkbM family methyltransferase